MRWNAGLAVLLLGISASCRDGSPAAPNDAQTTSDGLVTESGTSGGALATLADGAVVYVFPDGAVTAADGALLDPSVLLGPEPGIADGSVEAGVDAEAGVGAADAADGTSQESATDAGSAVDASDAVVAVDVAIDSAAIPDVAVDTAAIPDVAIDTAAIPDVAIDISVPADVVSTPDVCGCTCATDTATCTAMTLCNWSGSQCVQYPTPTSACAEARNREQCLANVAAGCTWIATTSRCISPF